MTMAQDKEIIAIGKQIAREIGDFIFTNSQENLITSGAIDTSNLFLSGSIEENEKEVVITYDAPYACVIGGRQKVKTINGHETINSVKDKVLGKDGRYHEVKILESGRFNTKPNGVLIRCEKQRGNGLFVTDDHLVSTVRNGLVVWEKARNLNVGDYVFRPKKIAWNNGTKVWITSICENCGAEKVDEKKRKYCSNKCYAESSIGKVGPNAGRTWKVPLYQRLKKCGKNNPAWKGGISKLPYGVGWTKVLKEKVKIRDKYTCQECKLKQEDSNWSFHVHHKDGDKFNNSMKNLTTLCPSCHGKEQWGDCELIDLDLSIFEPVKITEIEYIKAQEKYKVPAKVKLWDLSVEGENSFVCNGILIHNSAVNDGSKPHGMNPKLLEGWVRRKINPGSEAEVKSIAFLIARKIKERGTIPNPFMDKAIELAEIKFGIKLENP